MKAIVFMGVLEDTDISTIEGWLQDLEVRRDKKKKIRGRFHSILRHLRVTPVWKEPYYGKLDNSKDIGEIGFELRNIEYRIFGFFGPSASQFTLLLGCFHKGKRYTPENAIERAGNLKRAVEQQERRIIEYEFLG